MTAPDGIAQGVRRAILPVFVILLLVLGGASRGAFWANAALQIVSALILAWCLLDVRLNRLGAAAWQMLGLAGLLVLLTCLQLVPLPPEIWSALPGRAPLVEGFEVLGADPPPLPLSMTPEETLFGLLKFLPALAGFVLAARMAPRILSEPLSWTIAIGAAACVGMGLAQIFSGADSPLYVYEFTNRGSPVGFMANVNHQASLLLMSLPFCAVIVSRLVVNAELGDRSIGLGLIIFTLMGLVVLGVMIAGSTAGYGLLLPALLLSVLIGRGRASGTVTISALFGVSLVIGLLAALVASSPRLVGLGFTDLGGGTLSRPDTWTRTLEAISDTLPAGAGLGSFEALFPLYEDAAAVTSTFMNHAHNDYLEFVLDYGLSGLVLLGLFFIWFIIRTIAIWRAEGEDGARLRRAASVALMIVILHSIVDYPLRTGAVSGFAGLCLGLMAARSEPKRQRRGQEEDADAARHVTL
jgi:O-antigen ligase